MAVSSNLYPQMVEQRYNASMGRPTRLLKPVRVSVFESQVPTLLFARSLLLEILLSHHVQISVRRQFCPGPAVPLSPFPRLHKRPAPAPFCREPRDECRTPSRLNRPTPPLPSLQKTALV